MYLVIAIISGTIIIAIIMACLVWRCTSEEEEQPNSVVSHPHVDGSDGHDAQLHNEAASIAAAFGMNDLPNNNNIDEDDDDTIPAPPSPDASIPSAPDASTVLHQRRDQSATITESAATAPPAVIPPAARPTDVDHVHAE